MLYSKLQHLLRPAPPLESRTSNNCAGQWYGVVRTFTSDQVTDTAVRTVSRAVAAVSDGTFVTLRHFARENPRGNGRDLSSLGLAGVDAFEYLYKLVEGRPRTLHVYLHQEPLRDLFLPAVAAFPQSEIAVEADDPVLARLNQIAGHWVDGEVHRCQAQCAGVARSEPRRNVVATDASLRARHKGAGIACVSTDGVAQSRFRPNTGRVDVAELLAVELALDTFPANEPLHILMDSQTALGYVKNGSYLHDHAVIEVLARVDIKRSGRVVTFDWVRGHNGHPLNEAAHRLAVAARRCHTSHVSADARRRIISGILSDLG
ncbi:RNase H family protein [Hoyosella subflava]|uniref:RNase H type-1 domain-containing protein n=1 Tax=Hoyosella subflava (strain DSM 45089 / JCM 17490 / NBRC 109087 / DQS3-9A1) TaxID=443218 RepID=F6ELZ4_HOYSD|nr:RNase H family protein [Hoyosella subflava]AEF42775.1 hypothetical protein AS9A_4342 [Hoyosella subflava DQS3-9A1]